MGKKSPNPNRARQMLCSVTAQVSDISPSFYWVKSREVTHMNPITKALAEVKYRIPPEVLHTVFVNRLERWRDTPKSIEDQLLNLVVRPRVMVDCNLVGGTQI